jgi:hypothetical protein
VIDCRPVGDLVERRELLGQWDLQWSQNPLPQGLWAVEAADDGQQLGATLLRFSPARSPARDGVYWTMHGVTGMSRVCEVAVTAPPTSSPSVDSTTTRAA